VRASKDLRTWEKKHRPKLMTILGKVRDWNADYIVPVGRKSAKLFRTLGEMKDEFFPRVFYKEYFRFLDVSLKGKKVAIIDDVAKTCSTLAEYRDFFDVKGARVRTFALAGHINLKENLRKSYDPLAEIEDYVSEPGYRDFLLGEAEYLLRAGFYYDVNHLTLEMRIPPLLGDSDLSLKDILEPHGYTYAVPPSNGYPQKWSVQDPDFYAESRLLDKTSGIAKLRFHGVKGMVICVPMVLPDLRANDNCRIGKLNLPFSLPCQMIRKEEHRMDELCYWSISLFLSAELGRLFLNFLGNHYDDVSMFRKSIKNLGVRPIDFYRYFGIKIGTQLQRGIRDFLLIEEYNPDSSLVSYLQEILEPRHDDVLKGTFSLAALPKLIDHLKEGYRQACEKAGTQKGVYYSIPLERMEEVSGGNRLLLTEFLDCFCDLGTLVPATQVTPSSIIRTWRTGENEDILSWKRTQVLVPLAINVISEELGLQEHRANSLLLMKTLSNFVYDYPSKSAFLERLHCLVREPDIHGTVVKACHPTRAPRPVTLYDYKRLGDRYSVERKEAEEAPSSSRKKGVWFVSRDDALKDLSEFYDNNQEVALDEVNNYITFLARLYYDAGSTDVLTALSICRTPESFYWHVHRNLTRWSEEYGLFLDVFRFPYDEDTKKGYLHRSGEIANAGLKKVALWTEFDKHLKVTEQKATQVRFTTPRTKILKNVAKDRELPILPDVAKILSIQRALTGITLLKLFPGRKDRTPKEIEDWARDEFKRCGFSFDTKLLLQTSDFESMEKILRSAYLEVSYLVEILPDPKPESERERSKPEYVKAAHNRAVAVCKKAGWSQATFVHWDLTGSRQAGEIVVNNTATLYEYSDNVADRFGGKCMTLHPNGNDCMLYIFGNQLAALRAAAVTMHDFIQSGIHVKGGLAYANVELGKEHSNLIPAMGHAKDLCEFKDPLIGYRNRMNILVSSEFVDLVESEGASRNYFAKEESISIEHPVEKEKVILPIFKFDWERFFNDNR